MFFRIMSLNLNIFHDLVWEFIPLKDKDQELLSKFVLSGNEPLSALKNATNKVNIVEISRRGLQTIRWVSKLIIVVL